MIRVGLGLDVHPLVEGRPLILGGVEIPHSHGLQGHSDADVLSHAVGDALLGAIGAGDLGVLFPDTDPRYRGISSLVLLQECGKRVRETGFAIEYIDAVLVAQGPRLRPHFPKMVENLSRSLEIPPERIHLKATSPEGLGFLGRAEGILAQAVCLVIQAGGSGAWASGK